MRKFVSIALTAALSAAFAMSAVAAEKTLGERHGGMWPKSADGFVTKNQCLKCHGSYEALAAKTEGLAPNPHKSHMGPVNCEECHSAAASKPTLMCNSCHKFEVKKAAKK